MLPATAPNLKQSSANEKIKPTQPRKEIRAIGISNSSRTDPGGVLESSPEAPKRGQPGTAPTLVSRDDDWDNFPGTHGRQARSSTRMPRLPSDRMNLASLRNDLKPLLDASSLPATPSCKELFSFVVALEPKQLRSAHISRQRFLAMVRFLLDQGVDVNTKDASGRSALAGAARAGHSRVVSLLIDKGADIEAVDSRGRTPLFTAAQKGHTKTVEALIQKGAKANAATSRGHTALHAAVSNGHAEVIRVLVAKGADIEAAAEDGRSSLWTAAAFGDVRMIELLLELGANLHARDRDGNTVLHMAARYGQGDSIRVLVDKGADLESAGRLGKTPLLSAAHADESQAVKVLLQLGANANACNSLGVSALHLAAENGSDEIIKCLIKGGAAINARDPNGISALEYAMYKGHVRAVHALVERGADLQVPTKLHSRANHPIDKILAQQAEITYRTAYKQERDKLHGLLRFTLQPIEPGESRGEPLPQNLPKVATACRSILSSKCTPEELGKFLGLACDESLPLWYRNALNKAFALARVCGYYPKRKELGKILGASYKSFKLRFQTLQKDIDRHGKDGATLLSQAASRDDLLMITILVKLGAELRIRDKNSNTAMLSAAKAGNFAAVTELISLGADPCEEDFGGYSTLYYVAKEFGASANPAGMKGLIKYLGQKGYHFDHPNPDSRGPDDLPTLADLLVRPSSNLAMGLIMPLLKAASGDRNT